MNPLIQMLAQRMVQGQLNNMPEMQQVNQLLAGKSSQQQLETLFNLARSKGIDPNAKIFTDNDLRSLGLNISPKQG